MQGHEARAVVTWSPMSGLTTRCCFCLKTSEGSVRVRDTPTKQFVDAHTCHRCARARYYVLAQYMQRKYQADVLFITNVN